MPGKLTKAELVQRVERLMSGRWNDNEMEALFREIGENGLVLVLQSKGIFSIRRTMQMPRLSSDQC